MVEPRTTGQQSGAWKSAFQEIRADFLRLTGDFPTLGDSGPFSPQAYNAISATVMESLYECIGQLDELSNDISYHSNLGVILFCELQRAACLHYFREYERICGFVDARAESDRSWVRQPGLRRSMVSRATGKIMRVVAGSPMLRARQRVGWAGTVTFPWHRLAYLLRGKGVRFLPVQLERRLSIPRIDRQTQTLELWASSLHRELSAAFGVSPEEVREYGSEGVEARIQGLSAVGGILRGRYDLIVTGTLGGLRTRVAALQAQASGTPVLTIDHGVHYWIFDEPYWPLYEGALPEAKIIHGSIGQQRGLGTLDKEVNLAGSPILLYSRSDPGVRRTFSPRDIKSYTCLAGLTALYIASEFESARYGPYRDVHPATYLGWQEQLLAWLEKQTGRRPLVRLHPKRPSKRYDPIGYRLLENDGMPEVLQVADVLVIDYPTTALAYAAATDKPVLFLDLGLRRLYPAALKAIHTRCYYAPTNMLAPEEGFSALEADLSRQCTDTFTPVFSLADKDEEEVTAVAGGVGAALSQLWPR